MPTPFGLPSPSLRAALVLALGWLATLLAWFPGGAAHGQNNNLPPEAILPTGPRAPVREVGPVFGPARDAPLLAEVRVVGNETVPESKVRSYMKSIPGRPFNPDLVERDVRTLVSSGLFRDVRTFQQNTPQGVALTFQVFERPTIRYIRFIGNEDIAESVLIGKSGLKVGDALDLYAVDEAVRKVEDFYRSSGYAQALVTIHEGSRPTDKGVVLLVNEGSQRNILATNFVGNTIVTGARLRTIVQTVPGFAWTFGGKLDEKVLAEDLDRLTAYYRGLGYFRARVGRELEYSSSGRWVTITFIIDEGPRYKVREVSFVGNQRFTSDQLASVLDLKPGDDFVQEKMSRDLNRIREAYGSQGYVFLDVKAEPRFGLEPGVLDLVYDIREGDQYRVGQIHVRIDGETPHTRRSVVLNRLSIRPGDIIDSREVRASERRLGASQLFEVKPAMGITPRIVVKPPRTDDEALANQPGSSSPR